VKHHKQYVLWGIILAGIFALTFGQRYMLRGLEFTPGWYQRVIRHIAGLSRGMVLAIKLAECARVWLFWLGGFDCIGNNLSI
jgi:hypothetical protein